MYASPSETDSERHEPPSAKAYGQYVCHTTSRTTRHVCVVFRERARNVSLLEYIIALLVGLEFIT